MKIYYICIYTLFLGFYSYGEELQVNKDGSPNIIGIEAQNLNPDLMSCNAEGCSVCHSEEPNEQNISDVTKSFCDSAEQEVQKLSNNIHELMGGDTPFCSQKRISNSTKNDKKFKKQKKRAKKQCKQAFRKAKKMAVREAIHNKRFLGAVKLKLQSFHGNSSFRYQKKSLNLEIPLLEAEDGSLVSNEQMETAILETLLEDEKYKKIMEQNVEPAFNASAQDNKRLFHPYYKYKYSGTMGQAEILDISNGKKCKMKIDLPTFPKPETKKPRSLPPMDFLANFPNDCTFLVSKNYSEEEASKLLGYNISDNKNRSKYCNKSSKEVEKIRDTFINDQDNSSDKDPIAMLDERVEQLLEAAEEGFTPNFNIISTRNLYDDKTKDLAVKRGQFVQKYLWNSLNNHYKKNPDKERPEWLQDFDSFTTKIKVEAPVYDENKSPGDFGPSPYAKNKPYERLGQIGGIQQKIHVPSQQDQKEKLKMFLLSETERFQDKELELNTSLVEKETAHKELSSSLPIIKQEIKSLQKTIDNFNGYNKPDKFKVLQENLNKYSSLNIEYQQTVQSITLLNNQIPTLKSDLTYTKNRLSKINVQESLDKLDKFYKNKNDPNAVNEYRQYFKQFKKVNFEGSFEPPISEEDILGKFKNPRLKALLHAKVNMLDYQCKFDGSIVNDFSYREVKDVRDPPVKKTGWFKKWRAKRSWGKVKCPWSKDKKLKRWISKIKSKRNDKKRSRRTKRQQRINNKYSKKGIKYGKGDEYSIQKKYKKIKTIKASF